MYTYALLARPHRKASGAMPALVWLLRGACRGAPALLTWSMRALASSSCLAFQSSSPIRLSPPSASRRRRRRAAWYAGFAPSMALAWRLPSRNQGLPCLQGLAPGSCGGRGCPPSPSRGVSQARPHTRPRTRALDKRCLLISPVARDSRLLLLGKLAAQVAFWPLCWQCRYLPPIGAEQVFF